MKRVPMPAFVAATIVMAMTMLLEGCATAVMSGAADGRNEPASVREDMRITHEVRSRLYRDPELADARIQVLTKDGVVTLRGRVERRLDVNRAMRIAESVDGVRGVDVELEYTDTP